MTDEELIFEFAFAVQRALGDKAQMQWDERRAVSQCLREWLPEIRRTSFRVVEEDE